MWQSHVTPKSNFPLGSAMLKTMGVAVSWEKRGQQLVGTEGFVYILMMNSDGAQGLPCVLNRPGILLSSLHRFTS